MANNSPSMKGKLIKGALYILGSKALALIIGLASTVVLARLLEPEDFGIAAIAMSLMIIINSLSKLSLSQAIVQIDKIEEEHFDTAWTLGLIRGLILAVILLALSYPVAFIYGDERLIAIFWVLTASVFLGGINNPKLVNFIRELDFKQEVIISISQKLVSFLTSVVIAVVFKSYWALIMGGIASQIVTLLLSYTFAPYRPKLSLKKYSDLLSFSIWITLGTWFQTLSWKSDPLILGYFVPIDLLGKYSMAQKVTNMATGEITAPISQVLFPALSRIKNDKKRFKSAYLKANSIIASLAMPAASGLALIADPLVELALGVKWLSMVPFIQLLALTAILKSFEKVRPVAMATGNTKALFYRDFRVFIIRLPLILTGMYFGHNTGIGVILGALFGIVLNALINTVWNMQLINQVSQISIREQLLAIWRTILATSMMTVCIFYLHNYTALHTYDSIILVPLLFSIGAAVYIGTMVLTWVTAKKPDGLETVIIDFLTRRNFGGRN